MTAEISEVPDPAPTTVGEKERVLGSASWLVAGSIAIRLFGVLNIVLLSRILSPDDFGTMALAMIAVGLSAAFVNRQFDLILVRTPDLDQKHFDNAFTMSALMGLFLTCVIFCVSVVFSWIGNEKFSLIYLSVAVLPLVDSAKSTRFLLFEKANNMRPSVFVDLSGKIVQIIAGVCLALWLQNFWALIIAAYSHSVTRVALTYVMAPYKPRISFSHWQMFLGAGSWLSGVGFIGYGMLSGDNVIVGILLTTAAVGYLSISLEIIRLTSDFLANSIGRAIYPAFARMRNDKQRIVDAYAKAQALVMFVLLPTGCGLGLTASEFIPLFLGHKWESAIPIIQIIAPFNGIGMLVYMIQPILIAQNDIKNLFFRNLTVFIVFLGCLTLLVPLFGLLGAALSRVLPVFVHVALSIKRAELATQLSLMGHVHLLWRSIVSTIFMSIILVLCWPSSPSIDSDTTELLIVLISKVTLGGTVYFGSHCMLWFLSGRPKGVETNLIEIARGLIAKLRPSD